MFVSRQLPLSALIELCRALRHNLAAGLTLRDVFRQQASRGALAVRPVAGRISDRLASGDDLESALGQERAQFPPLFLAMAEVGEQTGTLPDVFAELEKYFALEQRLRRQFWTRSAWPLFQMFAAFFVVAGMLFVLGILGSDFAPLGRSFRGVGGAVRFLVLAFGSVAAVVGVYILLTRTLQRKAAVHALLLRVPVLGPCLQAVALARFCLCLHLTLDTSLALPKALRLCLRATGNGQFAARSDVVEQAIRRGEDLSEALALSRLFPEEFLGILATAEEGGRVPEAMRQQAEYYQDEAERRLKALTAAAAFVVWGITAGLIIFLIFSIFATYLGALREASKGL